MADARRPDPDEIRAALDVALGSETFARSERSRELLKYIVEKDLGGESDRLKGFAIALDVFGREDNFDPSTDAVVRVQARRLRDLLDTYYDGEGAGAAVRISVPRGSYVPAYECAPAPPEEDGPPAESGAEPAPPDADGTTGADTGAATRRAMPFGMRSRSLSGTLVALIVLLVCGVVVLAIESYSVERARLRLEGELNASEDSRIASAISSLPSVTIGDSVSPTLRAAFEDAIPRFGSVVYRNDKAATLDHPLADFHIEAVPVGRNAYNIQIYHTKSGILIGVDHLPSGIAEPPRTEHVARIMSRFLPAGEAIYSYLASDGLLTPLTECLMLGVAYYNDQTADRHKAAYRCHEKLIASGIRSSLSYAELATLTVESVTDHFDFPAGANLSKAVSLARQAVDLSPTSAIAHRALGRALFVSGEQVVALDEVREAYELNPFDLSIAASYGDALVGHGDFPKALRVLKFAVQAAPVHPRWWDYATFLAAFQQGDTALLEASARNLAGQCPPHYCAARLIAAEITGDDETRTRMLALLVGKNCAFLRDPLAYYEKFLPKETALRLVEVLRRAGLPPVPESDRG